MLRVGSVTANGVILLREEEVVVLTVELSINVVPDSVALPGVFTDVVNTDGLPVISDWLVAAVSITAVVAVASASKVLLTVCITLVVFTLIVVRSVMSSV